MGILKMFFKQAEPVQERGPFRVVRYWRELDEEKVLGVCRTREEVAELIHRDRDTFGMDLAMEFLTYHSETVLK